MGSVKRLATAKQMRNAFTGEYGGLVRHKTT